jgi:hypothetical protein
LALVDYKNTRDDLSHRLFEATDEVASFDWTDAALEALHRTLSEEMAREARLLAELDALPCPSPLASVPHAV